MSKCEAALQAFGWRTLELFQLMMDVGCVELQPFRQLAGLCSQQELALGPGALIRRQSG